MKGHGLSFIKQAPGLEIVFQTIDIGLDHRMYVFCLRIAFWYAKISWIPFKTKVG
jgi:hypothetical protein